MRTNILLALGYNALGLGMVETASLFLVKTLYFLDLKTRNTHSGFGTAGEYPIFQSYWQTGAIMGGLVFPPKDMWKF